MIKWGLVFGWHDASISIFNDTQLVFASDVERFSKNKNDPHLDNKIVEYCVRNWGIPEQVNYYEKPWLRRTRMFMANQKNIFYPSPKNTIRDKLNQKIKYKDYYHHETHAATAYYTSPYDDCAILVMDAIGEWNSLSIWEGRDNNISKKYSLNFPNSIGLFYTAMTHYIGLKPNEEEYILMGMAAYGDPTKYYSAIHERLFDGYNIKENLHRGATNVLNIQIETVQDQFDIAAATQLIYENYLKRVLLDCRHLVDSNNIVFGGGCALNCKANTIIEEYYDGIWIFPNPGDSGSSIGSVLAETKQKINIDHLYLGYNIKGDYPINSLYDDLSKNKIAFVANGRAEFGPRAFGNRSILAVPTEKNINNIVNDIKKRERFRPFAPIVTKETASKYFELNDDIDRYKFMQFTKKVLDPRLESITHKDGTARIQILDQKQHPKLHELLCRFDPPVLLNTSLNIKGQPLVNEEADAKEFETKHNVKVRTND